MMKVRLNGVEVELTSYASENILLDTNILVFANHKGSAYHSKASCIVLASLQGSLKAHVSSQNLLEFYSVLTSSKRVKPLPSSSEISRICSDLLLSRKLKKIFPNEDAITEAIEIAREKALRGPQIFDCLLAVTARMNKIDRIWTDNLSDMEHFSDSLHVENPLSMEWELLEND
ncbi:MAG TPA: type II toxin-antitoxin system VapC family toxin [Nitrososphaerales archaeon]|nr:type II toxin-antitoxin system VapC family toxin [Nitrososphaerales archaeon]